MDASLVLDRVQEGFRNENLNAIRNAHFFLRSMNFMPYFAINSKARLLAFEGGDCSLRESARCLTHLRRSWAHLLLAKWAISRLTITALSGYL